MEHPHLNNAPIAEAVIDFRFQPALNIEQDSIEAIHKSIATEYPIKHQTKQFQLGFVRIGGIARLLRDNAHVGEPPDCECRLRIAPNLRCPPGGGSPAGTGRNPAWSRLLSRPRPHQCL